MKKTILVSGAIFLGMLFLAGCGVKKNTGQINNSPAGESSSVSNSASDAASSQASSSQDSSSSKDAAENNQPAQVSDVDQELNQIDKDLSSVNANDFNANDLSDTGIEK